MYDIFVIGAGPAGYSAALYAAENGLSAAIAENDEVGGTCLNRGCIPTKALLHYAATVKEAAELSRSPVTLTFADMLSRCAETEDKLRAGISAQLKRAKVDFFSTTARIIGENSLIVGEEIIQAKNILIATGSRCSKPNIAGAKAPFAVTSNEILCNSGVDAKSIAIIGGGVIGCEIAEIYLSLGRSVTIIEAANRILPMFEREISLGLTASFKKRGVSIFTGARVSHVSAELKSIFFTQNETEQVVTADNVLISVGRSANTDGLFGNEFSVGTERGRIVTNSSHKTSVNSIYAVGDVECRSPMLAHYAEAAAKNAVDSIMGRNMHINEHIIPACVYTSPEIAVVGLNEEKAAESGIESYSQKSLTLSNARSLICTNERGFCRLTFNKRTDLLIGSALVCPFASELIGMLAAAINCKVTRSQLKGTVFPHPSVSEIIRVAAE